MSAASSLTGVAMVSGGSSGIGLAAVRSLRAAGLAVGFFSSSAGRVEKALATLASEPGPPVIGDIVNVGDAEAVAAFHGRVEADLGFVGALVCSAGISPKRNGKRVPLHETQPADWDATLAINLSGAFHCVRAALPAMMANRHGRIVLVGSIAARTTPKLAGAAYVTSKAGLSGLMRSVIAEYSSHGISCNIVAPGNILTDMVTGLPAARLAELAGQVPVGRLGTPDDVATMIELLCRRDAGFVNGAVIDINGGEMIAI